MHKSSWRYWLIGMAVYVMVFVMIPIEIEKIAGDRVVVRTSEAEAYSGACGVWAMKSGDFVATNFAGDAGGITAAISYCTSTGGVVQLGPGCEALAWMPDSLPSNVKVVQASWSGWKMYGDWYLHDKYGNVAARTDSTNLFTDGSSLIGGLIHAKTKIQLTRGKPLSWQFASGGQVSVMDVNYQDDVRWMLPVSAGTQHFAWHTQGDTVNKTMELKAQPGGSSATFAVGNATTITSSTFNGSAVFAQNGNVTIQGKATVWDSLMLGSPQQKGRLDVRGHASVVDSLRVNGGLYVGGQMIQKVLTATAVLDFNLTTVTVEDLTITVTGASVGDVVMVGAPVEALDGSGEVGCSVAAFVSAANTVTVRMSRDGGGVNNDSGTFRVTVMKF